MNLYEKKTTHRRTHPSGVIEEVIVEVRIPAAPFIALGALALGVGVAVSIPGTAAAIGGAVTTGAQAAASTLPTLFA